jgi:hypothetical protein
MAFRIYCATSGHIGYVMKLVRRAAILAIERKADYLDLGLLAESYDERLSSRSPELSNPFRNEVDNLKLEARSQVENAVRKTNRRSKRKG